MERLGRNISFNIYNEDGTPFHNLVIHKASYESIVMSLGDKITGDVYYKDNTLPVTMKEYITYKGVKYVLVNPPTIIKEGVVSENAQLKGMTKFSFEFYHPMYVLFNFPFTDVAVTDNEKKYLSQNKTFSWVGNLEEFIKKINANLENTEWHVHYQFNVSIADKANKISDVLSFDKNNVAEALKKAYDTWQIPFAINSYDGEIPDNYTRVEWVKIEELHQSVVGEHSPFWLFISSLTSVSLDNKIYYCKVYNGKTLVHHLIPCISPNNVVGLFDDVTDTFYGSDEEVTFSAGTKIGRGKKYEISFGLPNNRIYDDNGNEFIFKFGKGLGLKNNSRTPRKNKIVTRIIGSGSERNVPFGYPQIVWADQQHQDWDYTINNDPNAYNSYPIYDGIVGGQNVRLIKHPFTRTTLMPSIYHDTVNRKVNPNATGYDPDIEIKDYYDAVDDSSHAYPNNINLHSPSVEIHQFEDVYPRLTNKTIVGVSPYDGEFELISKSQYNTIIQSFKSQSANYNEKEALQDVYDFLGNVGSMSQNGGSYTYLYEMLREQTYQYGTWYHVKYTSANVNFEYYVWDGSQAPEIDVVWDDTINDEGEYVQSYFKLTLPILNFDLYASAAITQEMKINMRSGDCIGCTFPIQVDWEDYKNNFYDQDGTFDPVIGEGHPRNAEKYPDSSQGQITVVVQKETDTFGKLMPNTYQQPKAGDKFVVIGISLPTSYITDAENELDEIMKEYMLENNVYYYDYPLKFDEHFLATHIDILEQIKNNVKVSFQYAGVQMALFVKQITIKFGESVLPKYDIILTDDVEIVLNQIGQVTDDVSRLRVQVSELQKYYSENIIQEINSKLSKIQDDVCQGHISFQQGLDAIGSVIFHDEIRSPQFETGLYSGRGWRVDNLGNAEFESARVRSYLEVVELLVNRMRAQEGDTVFSDNDQIDRVDRIVNPSNNTVSYILSLKEKYQGYVTSQENGNILKGIINTLAAKQAGVSSVDDTPVTEHDGANSYFTSWMRVIGTHNNDNTLGVNQIRVILYSDNETPSAKNFEPCELMTIARWGCYLSPNEEGITEAERLSRERRQRMFMISVTDGRVVKYTQVNKPILENWNYGVTIGELPQFVKNYPDVRSVLNSVGEHSDWLYAQGVIVGKFIKVDIDGKPEVAVVDCGSWVDGSTTTPSLRSGIYLNESWNNISQQYETHDVWHNGEMWRCLINQPVTIGGVSTYYEPTEQNHLYWKKMIAAGQDASFYWLQASSSSVNVNSQQECTPDTLTIKVMHTQGGITTECTTMPTNKGMDVYFDGVLEYSFNDIRDDNHLFDTFRNGFPSDDFATVNTIEWVLRARRTTDVYDRVTIVATHDGTTGGRGKVGRFFYYAQEWEDSLVVSYVVNDAQAPYFLYDDEYWVFNPSENGTYTMHQMGTPSSANENWQIMTSDFKYIITEAIFGNFAHFGSAIINGDWVISTHGKTDGVAVTQESTISGKLIKESSNENFSLVPYLLFNPENVLNSSTSVFESTSSYSIDSSSAIQNITSAHLEKGNTYRLTIGGKKNTSDSVVYIRIYDAAFGSYQAIYLSSTSRQKYTATFQVDRTSEWYIQMYQPTLPSSSDGGAIVTEVNLRKLNFSPQYAVDLKTGASYQTKIYASGGLRSPFSYINVGDTLNDKFSDNCALFSQETIWGDSEFYLPWDVSQSGRKIVLTNYKWNGTEQPTSGYAYIVAPTGKYFYENGIRKNTLRLSREAIELLGFGDTSTFYGWLVLKRSDFVTERRYGRELKVLATGKVSVSVSGTVSVLYHTFDGTEITCTRNDVGNYSLNFSSKWYGNANHVLPIITPYGYSKTGGSETTNLPIISHVVASTTSITVMASDKANASVDSSFNFVFTNLNDWMHIESSADNQ